MGRAQIQERMACSVSDLRGWEFAVFFVDDPLTFDRNPSFSHKKLIMNVVHVRFLVATN